MRVIIAAEDFLRWRVEVQRLAVVGQARAGEKTFAHHIACAHDAVGFGGGVGGSKSLVAFVGDEDDHLGDEKNHHREIKQAGQREGFSEFGQASILL